MEQNQSHVGQHKRAKIGILSENVKICPFFVIIKSKIFVNVAVTQIEFCTFLIDFSCIYQCLIDNETQFFLFKASFLIILDFYICGFTNF